MPMQDVQNGPRLYGCSLSPLCQIFYFSFFFPTNVVWQRCCFFKRKHVFVCFWLFCFVSLPDLQICLVSLIIQFGTKEFLKPFFFFKKKKEKKEEEMKKMSLKSQRRPPGCHMKPQSTLCKASMCHYVVYIMCLLFKLNYS